MVSPIPSLSRVAIPATDLISPAGGGPGLCHPEMERVVDRLGQEPVGLDHRRHVGMFDRDLDVVEIDLFEIADLEKGRIDQSLRNRASVFLEEILVQRAGVDPDTDRHSAVLGLTGNRFDLVFLADIAGVEPKPLDTRLECGQGEPVLVVDVGDDRDRRSGDDLGQALCRLYLIASDADDVGAGPRQRIHLGQGAVDVGGLRGGHRLNRDGRIAPDSDVSDMEFAGSCGG